MLKKQVDRIRSETLQGCLGDRLDVFRPAVQPATPLSRLKVNIKAELGCDNNFALERRKRFAHQCLIDEGTVSLGGIKESHAAVHGRPKEGDHLAPVRRCPVIAGRPHAAKAQRRYFQRS
jgi:hypothetical protein